MARLEEAVDERLFRNYVSDSLQLIPQQKHLIRRYSDVIDFVKEPQKSAKDIITEVVEKAGLIV